MVGVNTEKPLRLSRHEPTLEGESMKLSARLQEPPANTRTLTWLTLAMPLLFACGQNASVPVNPDPYARGVSYPWAYTATEGQLSAQSLTPDINTLSFEPLLAAKNAWGPIELDHSNGEQAAGDGKTLTLDGKTYARGFGVHVRSEMRFSLKGKNGAVCKRFVSDIGVDDEVGNRGSVVFQVYLDGVKAYDSGKMTGASATKKIDLNIVGKQELRLVVTDAGNGLSYDHADWASPQVDCRAVIAAKSGTLDPSFGTGGIVSPVDEYSNDSSGDAALEPDGSIVYLAENIYEPVYKRLRPDGTTQRVPGEAGFPFEFIIRQPDGKFVVGGATREPFAQPFPTIYGLGFTIARLNNDLSPDTSFGEGGKVDSGIPNLCPVAPDCRTFPDYPSIYPDNIEMGAFLQKKDGKFLMSGTVIHYNLNNGYLGAETYLKRFTAAGLNDNSFGINGAVFIESFYDPQILAKPDGKIVVAFYLPDDVENSASGNKLIIRQLNADGSLDKNFGTGGQLDKGRSSLAGAVIAPDGNLLLSIVASGGPQFERISPTGKTIQTVHLASNDGFEQLTFQADGRLLATTYNVESYQGFLIRFKSDLSLDTTFGVGGKTALAFTPDQILLQSDGKIIVTAEYPFAAARYFP